VTDFPFLAVCRENLLLCGFNAFCNDPQPQVLRRYDDRFCCKGIIRIDKDLAENRLVYFKLAHTGDVVSRVIDSGQLARIN
jgi:hypothetical protein